MTTLIGFRCTHSNVFSREVLISRLYWEPRKSIILVHTAFKVVNFWIAHSIGKCAWVQEKSNATSDFVLLFDDHTFCTNLARAKRGCQIEYPPQADNVRS